MSGTERVPRRAATLVVLALVLALTGCSPAAPKPTSTPSPTQTPYFASEDAALDAATKTYERFVALSDQVLQAGGQGDDVYRQVLTGKALKADLNDAASFRSAGNRSTGSAVVEAVKAQRFNLAADSGDSVVVMYSCLDIANVDVVGPSGESIVDPNRKNKLSKIIDFIYSKDAEDHLLISSDEYWTESDFCAESS